MSEQVGINICSDASFAAGSPEFIGVCFLCFRSGTLAAGWMGTYCAQCGMTVGSEDWMGDIAERRRKYLKLERAEIAKLFGVFPSTITYYETKRCSKKYFKFTEKLVRERNKSLISERRKVMDEKLKPCPFCGSPAEGDTKENVTLVSCSASECAMSWHRIHDITWNNRTDSPELAQLREQLEEAKKLLIIASSHLSHSGKCNTTMNFGNCNCKLDTLGVSLQQFLSTLNQKGGR